MNHQVISGVGITTDHQTSFSICVPIVACFYFHHEARAQNFCSLQHVPHIEDAKDTPIDEANWFLWLNSVQFKKRGGYAGPIPRLQWCRASPLPARSTGSWDEESRFRLFMLGRALCEYYYMLAHPSPRFDQGVLVLNAENCRAWLPGSQAPQFCLHWNPQRNGPLLFGFIVDTDLPSWCELELDRRGKCDANAQKMRFSDKVWDASSLARPAARIPSSSPGSTFMGWGNEGRVSSATRTLGRLNPLCLWRTSRPSITR